MRQFDNYGTTLVTGGGYGIFEVYNYGTLEMQGGKLTMNATGGTLHNYGTFRTAAGTYNLGPYDFRNYGPVLIQRGQLNSITNSIYRNFAGGTWTMADGALIAKRFIIDGGTLNGNGLIYRVRAEPGWCDCTGQPVWRARRALR